MKFALKIIRAEFYQSTRPTGARPPVGFLLPQRALKRVPQAAQKHTYELMYLMLMYIRVWLRRLNICDILKAVWLLY